MCEFEMPAIMFALIGISCVGIIAMSTVGMVIAVYSK